MKRKELCRNGDGLERGWSGTGVGWSREGLEQGRAGTGRAGTGIGRNGDGQERGDGMGREGARVGCNGGGLEHSWAGTMMGWNNGGGLKKRRKKKVRDGQTFTVNPKKEGRIRQRRTVKRGMEVKGVHGGKRFRDSRGD